MKSILLSSLLLTAAFASHANSIVAPVHVCLKNNIITQGYNIQEQLSYPGDWGLWSGEIHYGGGYTCMQPYDWKANVAPFIDMYAVYHSSLFPYFLQCTPGMVTSGGAAKAPEQYLYYEITANNIGAFKCSKMNNIV